MMITFSHIVNGRRVPLIIDGREYSMQVEAVSKSEAIYKPEVKAFCETQGGDCRVRQVTNG